MRDAVKTRHIRSAMESSKLGTPSLHKRIWVCSEEEVHTVSPFIIDGLFITCESVFQKILVSEHNNACNQYK